ncbi:MAG: hypothetical protein A2V98_18180 [Planctomycetes bacterium RBG_16_64_12]|nr:MAG: hypothetical protein A2V98_18180 [Planctomycetes bacterium RBG_16_64_12]
MLLAALAAAGGCTSALATAVWLVKGPDIPAEYDGLRAKRVVVVCRPVTSSLYANPGVAKDISREISRLLASNVSKIEVVDQQKVAEWVDTNTWDDYLEIGKALEADMVVAVDLEHFTIYEGQTLYQGKANLTIQVYDCKTGEMVFERTPPQMIYPPNHVVSTSDVQEPDFRREFVGVLSDEVARHFYPHDPRAYWAMDARAMH